MPPEDKNAAVLPRRIGGDWVLLHRPVTVRSGPKAEIWLSRSSDLDAWRAPERVMNAREGAWWDSVRIGIGPPPIETAAGWLLIYHGVRATVAGAVYRVGLALLDLERPNRVIHRSPHWVLSPSAPYERVGDVPNVVFPCGAVVGDDGTLTLYYGAADYVRRRRHRASRRRHLLPRHLSRRRLLTPRLDVRSGHPHSRYIENVGDQIAPPPGGGDAADLGDACCPSDACNTAGLPSDCIRRKERHEQ